MIVNRAGVDFLSERNIYLAIKVFSVSVRLVIPLVTYTLGESYSSDYHDAFLMAWTAGYLYLTLISCGFHDELIRTDKAGLIGNIKCSVIAITVNFSLLLFFLAFLGSEFLRLYIVVLVFNYTYSLVICAERVMLYKSKKNRLAIFSLFIAFSSFLFIVLCYFGFISIEEMLCYCSGVAFISSLYIFSGMINNVNVSVNELFTFYRSSFLLSIQVVLIGIYARLEQYIFASYSSSDFSNYFLSMRILDVFFVFLSFQSQYNLISSFKTESKLNILNYAKIPVVLFFGMASVLVLSLAIVHFSSLGLSYPNAKNVILISLLCSPMILLKAVNNFFVDLFKREVRDRTNVIVIVLCIAFGIPVSMCLISEFGLVGAIISAYFKLIIFILLAGANEKLQPKII
ncbi:hypothetical protein Q6U52_001272 [Vibrio alginolyticus]|nr:hypothetical protein [Vibrio alginolyticus]